MSLRSVYFGAPCNIPFKCMLRLGQPILTKFHWIFIFLTLRDQQQLWEHNSGNGTSELHK